MSASLLGVPWPTIIAAGVAFLLVATIGLIMRAILRGDLVPRKAVDDIRVDRDGWREAWQVSQETMGEFRGQMDTNTEALRLVYQLVDALATKGSER